MKTRVVARCFVALAVLGVSAFGGVAAAHRDPHRAVQGAVLINSGTGTKYFTEDWFSGWGVTAYVVGHEHLGVDVTPKYRIYRNCAHGVHGGRYHNHARLRCKQTYNFVQSVYRVGVKIGYIIGSPCLLCETLRSDIGDRDFQIRYWWYSRWPGGVVL